MGVLAELKRRLYAGGRPGRLMRLWNRFDARIYGSRRFGVARGAALRVVGRHSGRSRELPVVVTRLGGREFIVSMLGESAAWVRDVRAAGGLVTLRRHGRDEAVRLGEIAPAERPPVLRRFAAVAPGARPHLGVAPAAPVADFERIAVAHPVFVVQPISGSPAGRTSPSGP